MNMQEKETGTYFQILDVMQRQLEMSSAIQSSKVLAPAMLLTLVLTMEEENLTKGSSFKWMGERLTVIQEKMAASLKSFLRIPAYKHPLIDGVLKMGLITVAILGWKMDTTAPLKKKKEKIEINRVKDYYLEIFLQFLESSTAFEIVFKEIGKIVAEKEKERAFMAAFLKLYTLFALLVLFSAEDDSKRLEGLMEEVQIVVKKEIQVLKEYGYALFILEQVEGALEEQKMDTCLEVLQIEIEAYGISFGELKKEMLELREKIALLLNTASESTDDRTDKKTHVYFAA
jgi:hypothetical protein